MYTYVYIYIYTYIHIYIYIYIYISVLGVLLHHELDRKLGPPRAVAHPVGQQVRRGGGLYYAMLCYAMLCYPMI